MRSLGKPETRKRVINKHTWNLQFFISFKNSILQLNMTDINAKQANKSEKYLVFQ